MITSSFIHDSQPISILKKDDGVKYKEYLADRIYLYPLQKKAEQNSSWLKIIHNAYT